MRRMDKAWPFTSDELRWLVGGVAALALVGAAIYWFSPAQRALRTCEFFLKAQLKAPSTYTRTTFSDFTQSDPPGLSIEYEAENAFGVPIRGSGSCTLNADLDAAVWYDFG